MECEGEGCEVREGAEREEGVQPGVCVDVCELVWGMLWLTHFARLFPGRSSL